jgi:electron transfer flavoprotein alpha/beta subunit
VANYQNKVATIVSGRESLAAKMKSSAIVRTVNLDLKVPYIVTEVLNGINVPRVYNFGQIKATVIVPVDWSAAQCKNLRVLGSNALVNAAIGLMIDEAEFVW